MGFHRIQWEFEATVGAVATSGSKAGWTEAWYDNRDISDAQALQDALLSARARRAILTPGWSLTAVRVSNWSPTIGLSRKGTHAFIPPGQAIGLYPGTAQDEQPYDALVIACNTAFGNARSRDIRGIPAEIINAGGRYTGVGEFPDRFNLFIDQMTGETDVGDFTNLASLKMAFRIRTANGPFNIVAVSTGGVGAPPGASIYTPVVDIDLGGSGFLFGSTGFVTFAQAVGISGLQGTWKFVNSAVLGPTNPTWVRLWLARKRKRQVNGVYSGGGTARIITYALDSLAAAFPGYGTSRRTGRPSRLPRGRQSARA